MLIKVMMLLVLASVMIGSSFSAPQLFGRPGGLIGLRRPGLFGGRPLGLGNQGFAPG
jgi:hypothetical protein